MIYWEVFNQPVDGLGYPIFREWYTYIIYGWCSMSTCPRRSTYPLSQVTQSDVNEYFKLEWVSFHCSFQIDLTGLPSCLHILSIDLTFDWLKTMRGPDIWFHRRTVTSVKYESPSNTTLIFGRTLWKLKVRDLPTLI